MLQLDNSNRKYYSTSFIELNKNGKEKKLEKEEIGILILFIKII